MGEASGSSFPMLCTQKIIEWIGLEETLQITEFQTPAVGRAGTH